MSISSINLSTFLKLTLLCHVLANYAHNFFNLLPLPSTEALIFPSYGMAAQASSCFTKHHRLNTQ